MLCLNIKLSQSLFKYFIKKPSSLLVLIAFCGCNDNEQQINVSNKSDTAKKIVAPLGKPTNANSVDTSLLNKSSTKIFSNERFRNVTVEKNTNEYLVKGKAQIFEARFGWVIEDGHNELQKGSAATNAGAPEWGDFSFTIKPEKINPNSTLHLILFESSAKDGTRQYELPIALK